MKTKLALVGCGTVGQGLLEILLTKAAALKRDFGFEAKVVAITDKIKGTVILTQAGFGCQKRGARGRSFAPGGNLDAFVFRFFRRRI